MQLRHLSFTTISALIGRLLVYEWSAVSLEFIGRSGWLGGFREQLLRWLGPILTQTRTFWRLPTQFMSTQDVQHFYGWDEDGYEIRHFCGQFMAAKNGYLISAQGVLHVVGVEGVSIIGDYGNAADARWVGESRFQFGIDRIENRIRR